MRRVSPETHQLQATFRPDRHDGSYRNFRKELAAAKLCDWELHTRDLVDLSPAAAAFVRRVDRHSMFNKAGGKVLLAVARQMDEIAELEALIRTEGPRVAGSRGREKVNPNIRYLQALKRSVARVLKHFHLSPDGHLLQSGK